jgi:hypothetical protein
MRGAGTGLTSLVRGDKDVNDDKDGTVATEAGGNTCKEGCLRPSRRDRRRGLTLEPSVCVISTKQVR